LEQPLIIILVSVFSAFCNATQRRPPLCSLFSSDRPSLFSAAAAIVIVSSISSSKCQTLVKSMLNTTSQHQMPMPIVYRRRPSQHHLFRSLSLHQSVIARSLVRRLCRLFRRHRQLDKQ